MAEASKALFDVQLTVTVTQTQDSTGQAQHGAAAGFFDPTPLSYRNLDYAALVTVEGILKKHLDAAGAELLALGQAKIKT